jgi:hypothetical protein
MTPPPPKNNNGPHPWTWFTDKVLPSLFVATAMAVSGSAWFTYRTVIEVASEQLVMKREIDQVKADLKQLREATVSKTDLLETLKRVEQQLEIMMLRAGIRPTPRVVE